MNFQDLADAAHQEIRMTEATEEKTRITCRPAVPFDTVNVARLVKEMLGEAKTPLTAPNDKRLIQWVSYVIAEEFCAVAEIKGRIIGTIGFSAFRPPWGDEVLMQWEWFYVVEAFRSRGTSDVLLDIAEQWAKKKQLRMYGNILNGTYSNAVNKRINEGGYHKVGLTFLKDFGDAK